MSITDLISQIWDLLPAELWWVLGGLAVILGCVFGARGR